MRRLIGLIMTDLVHPIRKHDAPAYPSRIGVVSGRGHVSERRQAGDLAPSGSFSDYWRWCGQ